MDFRPLPASSPGAVSPLPASQNRKGLSSFTQRAATFSRKLSKKTNNPKARNSVSTNF